MPTDAAELMRQVDMLGYYWQRIARCEMLGVDASMWRFRLDYERGAIERTLNRIMGVSS